MDLLVLFLAGWLLGGKAWAAADPVPAELRVMSKEALEKPSPAARRNLEQFARRYRSDANGALAYLVLGYAAYQQKQYAQAQEQFQAARTPENPLRDYAEYYLALSEFALNDHAAVAKLLEGFAGRYPSGSLAPGALRVQVESLLALDRAADARAALVSFPSTLSQPEMEWLLAEADRKDGQLVKAAERYQRTYYEFPLSPQADEAEKRLKEIKAELGAAMPVPSPAMREGRADRLFEAKQWQSAQKEYQALAAASGPEGDRWAVRAGVCQFQSGATWPALTALLRMKVSDPDADAERLATLAAAYRRLDRPESMEEQIKLLGEKYPQSESYEDALFLAGNYYRTVKDTPRAIEYYRQVFERFPQGEHAATSHWYVAWQSYRERRIADAKTLFEEHVKNYPASLQVSAALYWLGRLMERETLAGAAVYYQKLAATFPNYYYSLRARERLAALPAEEDRAALPAPPFLQNIPRPADGASLQRNSSPAEDGVLHRAKLLESAWLLDWAIAELSSTLRNGASPLRLGQELAHLERERGRYHVALRYAKRYVNGYFALDVSELARGVWELLFPLPWWEQVKRNAAATMLDPYLVAGLIRQESEFDPEARSRSNARGLMQLLPSTARYMAKQIPDRRARSYQLASLYRPEINLIYGTYYLRKVLNQFSGNVEYALAGYNAGERRVEEWTRDASFEDPAEFVESIPITETREYVQAVLRNAALYRKLYEMNSETAGSGAVKSPIASSFR